MDKVKLQFEKFKLQFKEAQRDSTVKADDLAEKEFKRLSRDKTLFVKRGTALHNFALREFRQLSKVYGVLPNNTPSPLGTVRNAHGKVVGYYMTRIDGKSLAELSEKGAKLRRAQLDMLKAMVRKLHRHGVAHGDLHEGNILIDPKGKLFLVDPCPRQFSRGKAVDEWRMSEIAYRSARR